MDTGSHKQRNGKLCDARGDVWEEKVVATSRTRLDGTR